MNTEISTRLLRELESRLGGQTYLYGNQILEVLDQAETPQGLEAAASISHRSYIAVSGTENSPAMDRLLLRRILRNSDVGYQRLPREAAVFDPVLHHFGFNSYPWIRNLMADQSMITLMHSSNYPYSLLAELKTPDETSGVITERPLLIIPGINGAAVLEWERRNTIYRKIGILGIERVITAAQYSRLQQNA